MHEMEFYEDDVEAYRSFEAYAGSFESIYYIGSGIDRTPAETFSGEVLHVDHDPDAVEYLSSKGLEAVERDVEEFIPERDFDLVLMSHLTSDSPLIMENIRDDGAFICSRQDRARKIDQRTSLNLEAVYRGEILTEEFESIPEARKYMFR